MRSSLALLGAFGLAASPVAAAAPETGVLVAVCGDHAPVPLPLPGRGKGNMPQGCHAACAAVAEKRKRLSSGNCV